MHIRRFVKTSSLPPKIILDIDIQYCVQLSFLKLDVVIQFILSIRFVEGTNMNRTASILASCLLLGTLVTGILVSAEPKQDEGQKKKPSTEAVERTRKTVRMLDDVYKTTVVLITDKYVNDEDDFPAGSAAIALFDAIEKKGWHGVRLIDVTGEPYEDKNVAKDEFEKKGVLQLKEGKDYYEEVIEKDGKPHLRAMTPVPVVMQKCVLCHSHYADVPKGAAVGAISYTLPIE